MSTVLRFIHLNPLTLMKIIIILGLLFLNVLLGVVNEPLLWFAALGLAVGLIGLLVLQRQFELGIIALIPVALLGKYEVGTGTNVPLNGIFLIIPVLIAAWLLQSMLFEKKIGLFPSRVNPPALLFIGMVVLSFINGKITWVLIAQTKATTFAQIGAMALYIFPVALLLLVGNTLKDLRWLRWMLWIFLFICGFHILLSFAGQYQLISKIFFPNNVLENPFGSMYWTWLVALSFGQFLINTDLKAYERLACGGLAAATLSYGWFFQREWVSGWLPPMLAIGVIVFIWRPRLGLALAFVAGLVVLSQAQDLIASVMSDTQEYSVDSRAATYPIMWELIKANPLLGLGPANYYYYTQYYPIMGFYVNFNSHSQYVDILAQTGLVGFALFSWLVAELGWLLWRLSHQVASAFDQSFVIACLGGFVAMLFSGLLGDWFLPFLYNVGIRGLRMSILPWIFLGGVLAISRQVSTARNVFPQNHTQI